MLSRKAVPEGDLPPTEGLAIYLLLDQSGSMSQPVDTITPEGYEAIIPKIDILKQFTKQFILSRPNDMIGMIKFARIPTVEDPLTLDHQAILDQLKDLQVVTSDEDNGTAMGYAIYKTASLIAATRYFAQDLITEGKPAYSIKDALIILVTDGFQEPSPLDAGNRLRNIGLEQAAEFAKENQVRLYIANVDPSFTSEEFAPNRRLLQRITELTGGRFFMAEGKKMTLGDVFASIDKLEKSRFPEEGEAAALQQPNAYRKLSLYPFLIAMGMACLAFASICDTLIWRRLP